MPQAFPAHRRATARLRIRDKAPRTSAAIVGYLEAGSLFEAQDRIEGDAVNGNVAWFALAQDRFVWSGATEAADDPARLLASAAMKVKRRTDGTIEVLDTVEREQVFGAFTWRDAPPRGAIVIDDAWVKANLVEVDSPILAHTGHKRVTVHRKAAEPFRRVFDKITTAGLTDVVKTCAGTWVPRHMGWDPRRGLSTHSWGAAIDLNAGWNGYGATPAPLGSTGCVRELVAMFESEGFGWGGFFKPQPICDGMHFELARLDL